MAIPRGIGLGTFQFSNVFTPVNRSTIDAIIRAFIDLGGEYIDTAPKYGLGDVEEQVGHILTTIPRSKFYLATKCGILWDDQYRLRLSGRFEDIISDCENSLRRLRTDIIDLYIVHMPDPNSPAEETMAAMTELKRQGKIRHIGVSNVNLSQLRECNEAETIDVVQNRFSLVNQEPGIGFLEYCAANRIAFTPYMVIERGLLTDRILDEIKLEQGDLRREMLEFETRRRETIAQWVRESIKPVADCLDISIAALAISWVLHQPAVTLCICGATNLGQLRENIQSGKVALTGPILAEISDAYCRLTERIDQEYSVNIGEFLQGPAHNDPVALLSRGTRRRTD